MGGGGLQAEQAGAEDRDRYEGAQAPMIPPNFWIGLMLLGMFLYKYYTVPDKDGGGGRGGRGMRDSRGGGGGGDSGRGPAMTEEEKERE
jgi:hypothetical protein